MITDSEIDFLVNRLLPNLTGAMGWERVPTILEGMKQDELRSLLTRARSELEIQTWEPGRLLACPKRFSHVPETIHIEYQEDQMWSSKGNRYDMCLLLGGALGLLSYSKSPWSKMDFDGSGDLDHEDSVEQRTKQKRKHGPLCYFGQILTAGDLYNELGYLMPPVGGTRVGDVMSFTLMETRVLRIPRSTMEHFRNLSFRLDRNLTACGVSKLAAWHRLMRQSTPGERYDRISSAMLRLLSYFGTPVVASGGGPTDLKDLYLRLDISLPVPLLQALTGDFEAKNNFVSILSYICQRARPTTSFAENGKYPDRLRLTFALARLAPTEFCQSLYDKIAGGNPKKRIRMMLRCASYGLVEFDWRPPQIQEVFLLIPEKFQSPDVLYKTWELAGPPIPNRPSSSD